jgi:hypothetical protein
MRELESKLCQDMTRRRVCGMVSSKQVRAECSERKDSDRAPGFLRQSAPPIRRPKVKSDFVNLFVQPIRTEAGAPHVTIVFQKKDRLVLNLVSSHRGNFPL